jgi:ABC-type transport system, involved in lipoprotein release, permease component
LSHLLTFSSLNSNKKQRKKKEIAILKTIGADSNFIKKIFISQGLIIGFIGTSLGLIIGLSVVHIGDTFHLVKLNPEVYLINYLPMKISILEVFIIALSSMLICFLSSLFPAISASKEVPAEVLRYD